jgi:cytochrome c peroxidase
MGHIRPVRADEDPTNGSSSPTGFPLPPGAMGELQQINHQIDATEAQTLKMINTEMSSMVQIQTLGKLELFDRSLSVQKNEACSTCHMPTAG